MRIDLFLLLQLNPTKFKVSQWTMDEQSGKWVLCDKEGASDVTWLDIALSTLSAEEQRRLSVTKIVLNAGDVLYLPSLWFHEVSLHFIV